MRGMNLNLRFAHAKRRFFVRQGPDLLISSIIFLGCVVRTYLLSVSNIIFFIYCIAKKILIDQNVR